MLVVLLMTIKNRKLYPILFALISLILITILSNAEYVFDKEKLAKEFDKQSKIVEKRIDFEIRKIPQVKNFELINEYSSETLNEDAEAKTDEDFVPVYLFSYVDKNSIVDNETDVKYSVSIYPFDGRLIDSTLFDEGYLISWVNSQIEDGIKVSDFNGNKVFYDKTNSYVFWKSGPFFIKVKGKFSDITAVKPLENNEFPTDIILEYLKLYPSDCNEDDCGEVLRNEDFFFQGVSSKELIKTLKDSNKEFSCPSDSNKEKIKKVLETDQFDLPHSQKELEEILEQCKSRDVFILKNSFKDKFLRECYNNLSNLIRDNFKGDNFGVDIVEYNYDYILEECINRKKFNEKYFDRINDVKNTDFFDKIFERQNADFFVNLRFIDPADVEERKKREEEQAFDPLKNYTLEDFPQNSSETMEEFIKRYEEYFKRPFNLDEWIEAQEKWKKEHFGES